MTSCFAPRTPRWSAVLRNLRSIVKSVSNGRYTVSTVTNTLVLVTRNITPVFTARLIRDEDYLIDREAFLGPIGYTVVDLTWEVKPSPTEFARIVGSLDHDLLGWESWPSWSPDLYRKREIQTNIIRL